MTTFWLYIMGRAVSESLAAIGHGFDTILFALFVLALSALRSYQQAQKEQTGWRVLIRRHLGREFLRVVPIAMLAWLPFFVWQLGYQTRTVEVPSVARFFTPPVPHFTIANPKTLPAPEQPLRITTVNFDMQPSPATLNGRIGKAVMIVGLTNKPIKPVNVMLSCNVPFRDMKSLSYGNALPNVGAETRRIDDKSYSVALTGVWTPELPIAVPVFAEANNVNCNFTKN